MVKRLSVILYWAIIIFLLCLFFSNDFGLVDIHKTSIIVAVGIDTEGEEVQVTAQVAVPQPSENGDNIQYTQVQGSGLTISDALNEINAKTGFYPKLVFCKLILVGEECKSQDLFKTLSCFYRRDFSELTPLVAMCSGKASDMLSMSTAINPETTTAIRQVLSDELEKSANVSSVNLKDIAEANFSQSAACYMPFIEANAPGTSEKGKGGDAVGGDEPQKGQSGGDSGGGSGGSSGGGGKGGQSGGQGAKSGGGEQQVEFTARKTAVFSNGKFITVLDEAQSFALDILKGDIRLAVLPFEQDGKHYTLGLKNAKGEAKLKVENGVPNLTISFKAVAQIQGVKAKISPQEAADEQVVSKEVLDGASEEIKTRFDSLVETCVRENCDLIGVRDLLHKYNHKYFDAFKADILQRIKVDYKIKIKSTS